MWSKEQKIIFFFLVLCALDGSDDVFFFLVLRPLNGSDGVHSTPPSQQKIIVPLKYIPDRKHFKETVQKIPMLLLTVYFSFRERKSTDTQSLLQYLLRSLKIVIFSYSINHVVICPWLLYLASFTSSIQHAGLMRHADRRIVKFYVKKCCYV